MVTPQVSVMIITKNQRRYLEQSLPIIIRQEGLRAGLEIIVVDSGSTDGAQTVVDSFPARRVNLAPQDFNYARAYNLGAAQAQGDILIRLSGDAIPTGPDWASALVAPFINADVAAVWGRQQIPVTVHNSLEKWADASLRPTGSDLSPRRYTRDVTVLGCNMALPRRLWEEHPFDERMPQAEDYAWVHHWYRRAYVGVYAPEAVVLHGHSENLASSLRRSLGQSVLQGIVLLGITEIPQDRTAVCR